MRSRARGLTLASRPATRGAVMSRITGGLVKLAAIAIAIALVGGGTAVAAGKISGAKLKAGTVSGSKLKKGSIGLDRLSKSARNALKGDRGATGPAGPPG